MGNTIAVKLKPIRVSQLENFAKKFVVNPLTGCWDWTGALQNNGYGTWSVTQEPYVVYQTVSHRFSYFFVTGNLPFNLELDHLCRNRKCVNPEHLQPVSARENVLRGDGVAAVNKAKTHCKKGHEFTPENTYYRTRPGRFPERDCKACRKIAVIKYSKKVRIVS